MKRDKESQVQERERALAQAETQARISSEQAETSLKAKTKTLALEEAKLAKIQDQLGRCTVRAPLAGIVVYPVPPDTDMIEEFIRPGNKVKERKHLFSIPDSDVLQIAASLHEALVNRVKPGQTGRITVDVVDKELQGKVQWISPTPDPEDWRRTAVKFYETKVSIDGPAEGLRPGMTAKVEILIEDRPNVLAVPVQSVVQHASKTKGVCYVSGASGLELRHLRLGKNSAEYVEVLEGLTAGERVVLSPDVIGIPPDAFEEAAGPSSGAQESTPVAAANPDATSAPADPAADPNAPVVPAVQETEFEAVLTGAQVTKAEAEFKIKIKEGVTSYKFQTEIEGGTPGASYDIKVDGVRVGSVTLDELGNCALELSTKFGNFPADFPLRAGSGTSVEVGPDLKGTLELQVN
jgi:RND family efflux transporter MFP subunit